MLIKDLIAKLHSLREKEMEHFDMFGEPSIEIDVFKCVDQQNRLFQYAGIHTGDIIFDRSQDGVYNIITAFAEPYDRKQDVSN